MAELAQPFRRLGADRTGSDDGAGLGLSIVAAITHAYRGLLQLRARPAGGLTVTITLPLAPHAVATAEVVAWGSWWPRTPVPSPTGWPKASAR